MENLAKGQNIPLPQGTVVQLHLGPDAVDLWLVSFDDADRVVRVSSAAGLTEPGVAILGPTAMLLAVQVLDPAVQRWWAVVTPKVAGPLADDGRAPRVVVEVDSRPVATYECAGVGAESAMAVVEVYRRGADLKLRAIGQGHVDGLAGLLRPHGGLPVAMTAPAAPISTPPVAQPNPPTVTSSAPPPSTPPPAASSEPASPIDFSRRPSAPESGQPPAAGPPAASSGGVNYHRPERHRRVDPPVTPSAPPPAAPAFPADPAPQGPTPPAAPLPPGTSPAERHLAALRGIFEDMARSTAGYQSSITFADQRRDKELEQAAGDPSLRNDPSARQRVDDRYDALVMEASGRHLKDMDQLRKEVGELEQVLPSQLADWSAPGWSAPPGAELGGGIRLGTLSGEKSPELKLPWALPLPLPRPLWVAGRGPEAVSIATAIITRLIGAAPAGSWRIRLVDVDGDLAEALGDPSVQGLLSGPPVRTSDALPQVLADLQRRTDLLDMARSADALDALPADLHPGPLLLVLAGVAPSEEAEISTLQQALRGSAPIEILLVGDLPEQAQALEALPIPVHDKLSVTDGWTGQSWNLAIDRGPVGVRWQDLARRAL